jgi:hypothetical protein
MGKPTTVIPSATRNLIPVKTTKSQIMKTKTELRLKAHEIAERLENGQSTTQIIKEYTLKRGLKRRTVERYIAFAKDLLDSRMKKREAIVEAVRADIIAEEAEKWLKSNLEMEARLCAIISGKVKFNRPVQTKEGVDVIICYPTCKEVIQAMSILFRLRGAYKTADSAANELTGILKIVVDTKEEKQVLEKIKNQ